MERITLDLTNYLDRYPKWNKESQDDYECRIEGNLWIDYQISGDLADKVLERLFDKQQ